MANKPRIYLPASRLLTVNRRLLFTCLLLATGWLNAQSPLQAFPFCHESKGEEGVLIYNTPRAADLLIEDFISKNEATQGLEGYRIQLYFSYSRNDIQEIKADFLNQYPDQKTYLVYEQPYFKLRVGNYRNLIEAQQLYHELLKKYGNVFIVPSTIDFPELASE